MTNAQKKAIAKMQSVLLSIANGKPKFFNTTQYENMGLVKFRNTKANGYVPYLTEKGQRILNTQI